MNQGESCNEEQAVVMDITDDYILRAVAAYHSLGPHPAPVNDTTLEPSGLSEAQVEQAVQEMDNPQACWDRVISAYMDGHVNLGRAATLLGLSRYELDERFRRLDVPRRIGPETLEEARAEVDAARAVRSTSARDCDKIW
jgi:predicted HTH domain antitoxin